MVGNFCFFVAIFFGVHSINTLEIAVIASRKSLDFIDKTAIHIKKICKRFHRLNNNCDLSDKFEALLKKKLQRSSCGTKKCGARMKP